MNNKKYSLKDSFKSSFVSGKDQFLKVEEMSNGTTYAITYNPQSQPDLNELNGFVDWWGEQEELFARLKGCKIRLYCETSKTSRLHFHGFLLITNRVKFALYSVPVLQKRGSTVVKPFDSVEGYVEWLAYCLKIQNDMQDFIISEFSPKFNVIEKSDSNKIVSSY